ncbi:MAG: hypothetical protein COV69_02900 [Parcubacteria group bacterium CG11_big_fil_rev_8_21_14_0_20_39_14]|nr:MAG: hypothetical protein COV69_02900 [Parcubacteria group bacterium CG11_big_fil_rev_8_21_14_0_20_39_14]PIS35607.1 MAG: hypothetical protein COT36_01510 [Parcubacteria group bacterium CG08_land_8_20_14_0_20_38_56]
MPDFYHEPVEEGANELAGAAEMPRPKSIERGEKKLPIEEEILELEKKLAQKREEMEKVKRLEGAVEEIGKAPPAPSAPVIPREEELTEEEKLSVKKIKMLSKERQLEILNEIALWRGLASAVKIAKALNNAYILDEFHDTLIDKLYKELVERGKIKET